jgi:hypothetical protein
MLRPEAGQGPAKDVRVCDACSRHTPSIYSCARTQRRPFHGLALLATSGLVESVRASRGRTSQSAVGCAHTTPSAPSPCASDALGHDAPGAACSVSMPTPMPQSLLLRHAGDDDVSCATTPTTDDASPPQAATRDPSDPVRVPRAPACQHAASTQGRTASRETQLLASLEDEHAHALQEKFAASSFYQVPPAN